MGTPCVSLRTYPKIRAVLTQISQDRQQEALLRKQQLEQEWVEKVNRAMECLQAEGKPVTQVAICHLVGMSSKGLFRYPRVKTILLQVADAYRLRMCQQNEQTLQALAANVQRSISELKSQGQPVTKKTVAKSIGVSRGILNYHHEIRMLFAQCPEWTGLPPRRPKEKATLTVMISAGQMERIHLPCAAGSHQDFLQLRWKTIDPLYGFFYSYLGKTGFSTVTLEITPSYSYTL